MGKFEGCRWVALAIRPYSGVFVARRSVPRKRSWRVTPANEPQVSKISRTAGNAAHPKPQTRTKRGSVARALRFATRSAHMPVDPIHHPVLVPDLDQAVFRRLRCASGRAQRVRRFGSRSARAALRVALSAGAHLEVSHNFINDRFATSRWFGHLAMKPNGRRIGRHRRSPGINECQECSAFRSARSASAPGGGGGRRSLGGH